MDINTYTFFRITSISSSLISKYCVYCTFQSKLQSFEAVSMFVIVN